MFVHIPESLKNSIQSAPMVVVLHGCSQYANRMAQQSGWNKLADLHGFYVLYPEQRMLNNPQGCFTWYSNNDISREGGEVASIKQMMDYMANSFAVDTTKQFCYGVSAGALMTVALLADYPAQFVAGASLAGGPFKAADNMVNAAGVMLNPPSEKPEEWGDRVRQNNIGFEGTYPKLIIYQGKQDRVVDPRIAKELIKQWTNVHGIDTVPASVEPITENEKLLYTKSVFTDTAGNVFVTFYDIDSIGHALAIDPGEVANQGGKTGVFAIDMGWHSTYHIAREFGLISKEDEP